MSKPLKICVIRLSALGDCCLFLPTIAAIRREYPDAEIVWVISPLEYQLVCDIEGVEFAIYDKKSGIRGAFELGKRLRNRRFDYLLMAQESLRASILSLFIKADIRVGFDRARSKDFQRFFCNRQIAPHKNAHLVENGLDFAAAIGARDLSIKWNLPIPNEAFAQADSIAKDAGKYFVLSPIANAVRFNWRNWTAEGYAAAIDYAREKFGLTAIVTGAPSDIDREMAAAIAAAATTDFINAVGKTSIKGLLALIKNAEFVLAPDSGPGHFAAALGTPAIALLACADPRRAAPYQDPSYCVDRYAEALMKFHSKRVDEVKFGRRVRDPNAMKLIKIGDAAEMIDLVMRNKQ